MVAVLAGVVMAPAAIAGTSNETYDRIRADLADNGRLDGQYNPEDVVAALRDATVQGYGNPVVVLPPPPQQPPAQPCTEVAPGTPGAVQAPNGKWYVNVPAGGAEVCGPAAPQPTPPTQQVTPPVAPPSGPTPPAPPAQPTETAQPAQPSGVLPAQKTVVQKPKAQPTAAPAAQPREAVRGEQSPLRQTRTTGTLPFTGAELGIFAGVGAALLGAGILLRVGGRRETERA